MPKTDLKVIPIDHFIFVCVKEVKQFKNFLIHVLVLDDAGSGKGYMEMMARNSDSWTWSQFEL